MNCLYNIFEIMTHRQKSSTFGIFNGRGKLRCLKVRSHWGVATATATEKLFSVVSVHTGGPQRQRQQQQQCTYIC